MHKSDNTPTEFLEYVKENGVRSGKTWTLEWSNQRVEHGVAEVMEVDPGVYNFTAHCEHFTLPKMRIDKGVFRMQVSDDDVTEWLMVKSDSILSQGLFTYFALMTGLLEEGCQDCGG